MASENRLGSGAQEAPGVRPGSAAGLLSPPVCMEAKVCAAAEKGSAVTTASRFQDGHEELETVKRNNACGNQQLDNLRKSGEELHSRQGGLECASRGNHALCALTDNGPDATASTIISRGTNCISAGSTPQTTGEAEQMKQTKQLHLGGKRGGGSQRNTTTPTTLSRPGVRKRESNSASNSNSGSSAGLYGGNLGGTNAAYTTGTPIGSAAGPLYHPCTVAGAPARGTDTIATNRAFRVSGEAVAAPPNFHSPANYECRCSNAAAQKNLMASELSRPPAPHVTNLPPCPCMCMPGPACNSPSAIKGVNLSPGTSASAVNPVGGAPVVLLLQQQTGQAPSALPTSALASSFAPAVFPRAGVQCCHMQCNRAIYPGAPQAVHGTNLEQRREQLPVNVSCPTREPQAQQTRNITPTIVPNAHCATTGLQAKEIAIITPAIAANANCPARGLHAHEVAIITPVMAANADCPARGVHASDIATISPVIAAHTGCPARGLHTHEITIVTPIANATCPVRGPHTHEIVIITPAIGVNPRGLQAQQIPIVTPAVGVNPARGPQAHEIAIITPATGVHANSSPVELQARELRNTVPVRAVNAVCPAGVAHAQERAFITPLASPSANCPAREQQAQEIPGLTIAIGVVANGPSRESGAQEIPSINPVVGIQKLPPEKSLEDYYTIGPILDVCIQQQQADKKQAREGGKAKRRLSSEAECGRDNVQGINARRVPRRSNSQTSPHNAATIVWNGSGGSSNTEERALQSSSRTEGEAGARVVEGRSNDAQPNGLLAPESAAPTGGNIHTDTREPVERTSRNDAGIFGNSVNNNALLVQSETAKVNEQTSLAANNNGRPIVRIGAARGMPAGSRANPLKIIKSIEKRRIPASAGGDGLWRRLCERLLTLPPHPNVLSVDAILEDSTHYHFIFERLQGGELFAYLTKEKKVKENVCRYIIYQILLALQHLHSHSLLHRDVKPENLVFRRRRRMRITPAIEGVLSPSSFQNHFPCSSYALFPNESSNTPASSSRSHITSQTAGGGAFHGSWTSPSGSSLSSTLYPPGSVSASGLSNPFHMHQCGPSTTVAQLHGCLLSGSPHGSQLPVSSASTIDSSSGRRCGRSTTSAFQAVTGISSSSSVHVGQKTEEQHCAQNEENRKLNNIMRQFMRDYELVLIDFDTCKMTEVPIGYYGEIISGKRRLVGTYGYLAPEVLCGHAYSAQSDLWSVGIILYILLTVRLVL